MSHHEHPGREALQDLALGLSPDPGPLREHLSGCAECAALLRRLEAEQDLLHAALAPAAEPPGAAALAERIAAAVKRDRGALKLHATPTLGAAPPPGGPTTCGTSCHRGARTISGSRPVKTPRAWVVRARWVAAAAAIAVAAGLWDLGRTPPDPRQAARVRVRASEALALGLEVSR